MRKPILLGIACLLLFAIAGLADTADEIAKSRDQAKNPSLTLATRVSAIRKLGLVCPRDCESLLLVKGIFKDLLANPNKDEEFKHNLLFYHIAQAIGNYGPLMRDLASELIDKMGRDRILDCAIEEALTKIYCVPIPPVCPPSIPMPPPGVPTMPGAIWVVPPPVSSPPASPSPPESPKTPKKSDNSQPGK